MGERIDGKAVSAAVRAQVAKEVEALAAEGTTVTLAVVHRRGRPRLKSLR